jgi:ribosomal protein S18 acetylase RimI-like enzyme
MTGIVIREFEYPADYAEALRLWQSMEQGVRIGPSDSPAEIEKKLQRDPDLFLVAEAAGGLAGTVIGGYDGRRGFVYHLAVAATFRRSGVGSKLMNEVEARLRGKGCIRSYLLVRPDNFEAMRHYQKLGWRLLDDQVFAKDLA